MAEEPNRNMDAMLRAYAKKRGTAPEFPVHPATRGMLQGEARRIHGVSRGRRAGWRAFIPQIAFGAAFCLIIGLTIAVLRVPPGQQKVAKNELSEAEGSVATAAARAEPEAALSLFEQQQVTLAPAPDADAKRTGMSQDRAIEARLAVNSSERADSARIRPELLARVTALTNLGAALRTPFVQTNLPAMAVLQSFQLEQLGEELKVIDWDGSVYTGAILPHSAEPAGEGQLQGAEAGLAANAAVYSFQANGTNQTLRRSVALDGQYFHRTNLPARERARPLPVKGTIVGRVVIGGTNEVPLRAFSVER